MCTYNYIFFRCNCNLFSTLESNNKTCLYKYQLYYTHSDRISYWFNHTTKVILYGTPLTGTREITHDYAKKKFFFSTVIDGLSNIKVFALDVLQSKTLVSNSK